MKINHTGKKTITVTTIAPKVVIELEAFKKMQCYIDLCSKEIGWLGTAYKEGDIITIKDVFLFDQEVHATTCELTPGGIADFVTNLYMTMDADDAMEISNNLTCWGHSHVNMGVSPSGQDDRQLRSFSDSGHEWFLRVIGNKRGEFEYTYMDYINGIEIKDLDWQVKIPGLELDSIKTEVKSEIDVKVKEKKYEFYPTGPVVSTRYSGYNNNLDSLFDEDFFSSYIREQQKLDIVKEKKEIKETENSESNVSMALSDNHDVIMDIIGNDSDLISDTEYEILDEALCQMTIDDLVTIASFKEIDSAASYIKSLVSDCFTEVEIDELCIICKHYHSNLLKLMKNN